jgi:hypothetical protein
VIKQDQDPIPQHTLHHTQLLNIQHPPPPRRTATATTTTEPPYATTTMAAANATGRSGSWSICTEGSAMNMHTLSCAQMHFQVLQPNLPRSTTQCAVGVLANTYNPAQVCTPRQTGTAGKAPSHQQQQRHQPSPADLFSSGSTVHAPSNGSNHNQMQLDRQQQRRRQWRAPRAAACTRPPCSVQHRF